VAVHFLQIGRGEQCADAEQITLHWDQDLIDPGDLVDRPHHADYGVELVDIAIGFDARVILLNPAAPEETSVAGVTGFSVNLHRLEM
jgi:hypothetical protein